METKNILHCSTLVTTSFAPHLGDTFFPPLGGAEEKKMIRFRHRWAPLLADDLGRAAVDHLTI